MSAIIKKYFPYIVILLVLTAAILCFLYTNNKGKVSLTSRAWMEYSMNIVRKEKPTPPASSRFYAYVSTVYYKTLVETNSEKQANLATAKMILVMYPNSATSTDSILSFLHLKADLQLNDKAQSILSLYSERLLQDSKQVKIPQRLYGPENWVGENPLEPGAGSWQKWITEKETFEVPPPPVFGSAEHLKALSTVKEAMKLVTKEQSEAIKFWGGGPGTEAPAGVWQNRLYAMVGNSDLSDEKYAYAQMVLAQASADSFIECWKVKYTYWTKRPNMADSAIDLIWMYNPNFPSYLSGHSTVSRTAAEVLSAMFPEYKEVWLRDAEEAKNSRLWAGIHFPYDNENGAELGRKVGQAIVSNLKLTEIK